MFDLLLVRHGQTDWNVQRRVMGMGPIGLNKVGIAQVRALALELADWPLDAIIASPARRTRETAEILLEGREGLVVKLDDAFAEVDYGDWVDRPFSDFEGDKGFNQYMRASATFQIPGGERLSDMQRRVVQGIENLRGQFPDGRAVVVSHADIIKSIIVHYLGVELSRWQQYAVANASLSFFRFHRTESDQNRGGIVPRLLVMNYIPQWVEGITSHHQHSPLW